MFSRGFEFKSVTGLNLIDGKVIKIIEENSSNIDIRIPNIGWRNLIHPPNHNNWIDSPLENISKKRSLYFAHSYKVIPKDPNVILACCDYQGLNIPAVIKYKNIFGCQFHPEKSGPAGLEIIDKFFSSY